MFLGSLFMTIKYIGIDFSGNQSSWNPTNQESNIWIANSTENNNQLTLMALQRVQMLDGDARPFARLAALLREGAYSAAAIDAPFSIPWWFFFEGIESHAALLAEVDNFELNHNQDFPPGRSFREIFAQRIPFDFSKPLRVTENYWRGRKVETRSPVWTGARPGAPFASACIKLLAQSTVPIWPFVEPKPNTPILIEAFPAAQLKHWGLPFKNYNGANGEINRQIIANYLINNLGLIMSPENNIIITQNADALDAVICLYAAKAVIGGHLGRTLPPFDVYRLEGWIAVHN